MGDGKVPRASDPHHLGGNTRTPPPLPVHGLSPDVESPIGTPDLPFGEAPGVHTDTAEDILAKERRRLGLERPTLGLRDSAGMVEQMSNSFIKWKGTQPNTS